MASRHLSVGVFSDTHGQLRPEAVAALRGSDLIVHAGERRESRGPRGAMRRNAHRRRARQRRPQHLGGVAAADRRGRGGPHQLYVLHILDDLDLAPEAAGFAAVISGHSHRPHAETRRGVLCLNPGSAGSRRFRLPVTVARLRVTEGGLEHEIVELAV